MTKDLEKKSPSSPAAPTGIGHAIPRSLAKEGAKVVFTGRREPKVTNSESRPRGWRRWSLS